MKNIPDEARAAAAKYREFHRYDPKKIGAFPPDFDIPKRVFLAGPAKWVTYLSGKVDPSTLRKPARPVGYIHEHDAGVRLYLTMRNGVTGRAVDVPSQFRDISALTRLGYCLGFCFDDQGKEVETAGAPPLPDLYTTPDGNCLLVIQSRREVIAMMWGGALGVFARGIDG